MASGNQRDSDDKVDIAEFTAQVTRMSEQHLHNTQLGFSNAVDSSYEAFRDAVDLNEEIERLQARRDRKLSRSIAQFDIAQASSLFGNSIATSTEAAVTRGMLYPHQIPVSLSADQLAAITTTRKSDRKPKIEEAWHRYVAENGRTKAELQSLVPVDKTRIG